MDKLERKVVIAVVVLMAIFASALMYAATQNKDVPMCLSYDGKFLEPRVTEIAPNTYEVVYVAGMWRFEPEEVEIPVGSEVDIYLVTKDVVHGFQLKEKAINLMAVPGGVLKKTVKFDKKGTFDVVCHEYCGTGHQNMATKLVVK